MAMATDLRWCKSSRSGDANACVEIGRAPGAGYVGVRDTKNRPAGQLIMGESEWSAFLTAVKAGDPEL